MPISPEQQTKITQAGNTAYTQEWNQRRKEFTGHSKGFKAWLFTGPIGALITTIAGNWDDENKRPKYRWAVSNGKEKALRHAEAAEAKAQLQAAQQAGIPAQDLAQYAHNAASKEVRAQKFDAKTSYATKGFGLGILAILGAMIAMAVGVMIAPILIGVCFAPVLFAVAGLAMSEFKQSGIETEAAQAGDKAAAPYRQRAQQEAQAQERAAAQAAAQQQPTQEMKDAARAAAEGAQRTGMAPANDNQTSQSADPTPTTGESKGKGGRGADE